MATAKLAASAVFGSVQQAAGTITDVFSTVSTGAKMLNDFVSDARQAQLEQLAANSVGRTEMLLQQKTVEIAKSRKELDDYIAANPQQSELITNIRKELEEALAKVRG